MKVVRQVYIYFGSYFVNAVISFFTVSLLTNDLTPRDYGIINLYSSFILFLMPFISGGTLFPLSVEYFKQDRESYNNYFTNAQVIPLISLAVFTVFCFAAAVPLASLLRVTPAWIYVLPIATWFIYINEASMMVARNKNQPWLFAGFSVGKSLLEMALTVGLVITLAWGWQGRLASAVLAPLGLLIFSVYFFSRWKLLSGKINWTIVRSIFLLSIPFIFERLSVFVLGSSDRYFIDRFDLDGTEEVGLYGLASQLASIVFLVVVSLNNAYHPYLFKRLSEGHHSVIHKSTFWYIGACAVIVGGMFIALPLLFRFFIGAKFHDAMPYAYILTGGYFMWGIYNAFFGYLIYINKSRQMLYTSVAGMCISLTLNFFMVPAYGAKGAAYTSIITYSVMALICYLYVRKYFLVNKS